MIGRDPMEREGLLDDLKRELRQWSGMGQGPLDIALWDMAGKKYNAPVSELIGGFRKRLPAYASTYLGDSAGGLVRVRTNDGEHTAKTLVLTAGAWTGSILPPLAPLLAPERQVMLWTTPLRPERFAVGVFPVFYIDMPAGPFYGFPSHGGAGFKIGRYHHRGERVDPDTIDRACHPEDEEVLREGIRRFFPDANGPTLAMKTCLFTNSPDEHFVIDRAPGEAAVLVAAGFSGHGFKFCSVVGEILADLALDGGTRHDISLFSAARLPPMAV